MKIQTKLLAIISMAFILISVTSIIINNLNRNQFNFFKNKQALQLSINLISQINNNSDSLNEWVNDHSNDNAILNLIKNPEYEDSTILNNNIIDAIGIFNLNKESSYLKSINLDSKAFANIICNTPIFNILNKEKHFHTFMFSDSLLIEVAATGVFSTSKTNRQSTLQGYLLIARVWNSHIIKSMEYLTNSKISIVKNKELEKGSRSNTITSFLPIKDWNDKTVCYILTEKKLDILNIYQTVKSNLFIVSNITLALLIIIAFSVVFWVNIPFAFLEFIIHKNDNQKIPLLKKFGKEYRLLGYLTEKLNVKNVQITKERDKANKEFERLKSGFLSITDHEIRTPLNAILGFGQLIKSNPNKAKEYAELMIESGKHLLDLFEEVNELATLEQGMMTQVKHAVLLGRVFDENKDDLTALLDISGRKDSIELVFKPSTSLSSEYIMVDRDKINRILKKIFKNAIKYTISGSIEFGYYYEMPGKLTFYIKDSGIGIPKDQYHLVFDSFRQIDDFSISRCYEGLGIGLSISKQITDVLLGTLTFESEPSLGTTFYLKIPIELSN